MRRSRIQNQFLLVEVVASLGLMACFSAGLLTPYAKALKNIHSFYRQWDLHRQAQLQAINLHTPGEILKYIPTWDSSHPDVLNNQVYQIQPEFDDSLFSIRMTCDSQTPLVPDDRHPAWRRLITILWQVKDEVIWQQSFIAISGPPSINRS